MRRCLSFLCAVCLCGCMERPQERKGSDWICLVPGGGNTNYLYVYDDPIRGYHVYISRDGRFFVVPMVKCER